MIKSVKRKSTYYTMEKAETARENIRRYAWAETVCREAVRRADKYTGPGPDFMRGLITPQSIPRSAAVCDTIGCPVCGHDIDRYGNYPWLGDVVNRPWKLKCPSCGSLFPSNDFESYYKSGLDENGIFMPEYADRRFLVNTSYPDRPGDWCVDDGYGWADGAGNIFVFIAYYNHFMLWGMGAPGTNTDGFITDALIALKDAYVYTGKSIYADTGIAMLDRIADVYPDMDLSPYQPEKGFFNSWGTVYKGKILGCIWETILIKHFINAYDAFFPRITDSLIKDKIENQILRLVYPAVKEMKIRGNMGMHQSALALAAVVLDDGEASREWLEYVFAPGERTKAGGWRATGGDILGILTDYVDRDGHGNEASPGYNLLWLSQLKELADILDGCDITGQAGLYKNPKFRKMFSALPQLVMCGRYIPTIADSSKTGEPGIRADISLFLSAFARYGGTETAQFVYLLNGSSPKGLHLDVFSENPEHVAEQIENMVRESGEFNPGSVNLTGYGLGVLRDGSKASGEEGTGTLRDLWLYYGRTFWHGHQDALNIGIHGYGMDISPDLGYPEFARHNCAHRTEWTLNTVSHNTVVVDKRKQRIIYGGIPRHFEDTSLVKLIEVEAPHVYPWVDVYGRSVLMLDAEEYGSYYVDFFRVEGGKDHYYSFHGAEGTTACEGLKLVRQAEGTYAGPEIGYMERWDDLENDPSYYRGSGFHYLFNVERDESPEPGFSIDWKIKDTWKVLDREEDIHLRLTMLTRVDDAAIADGEPPRNKPGNPKRLKYLLAHRNGEDLKSMFVSVIEPYKDQRFIKEIEEAEMVPAGCEVGISDAAAVKVTFVNGRVDYIIHTGAPDMMFNIDGCIEFQGRYGVYSRGTDGSARGFICHGTHMSADGVILFENVCSEITGVVTGFTKKPDLQNHISIRTNVKHEDIQRLTGKYIYVENEMLRAMDDKGKTAQEAADRDAGYAEVHNGVFRILGVEALNENELMLYIGDATTVRGFADDGNAGERFIYDIAEGDTFTIPLSMVACAEIK